jgi:hypothetical protein
MQSNIVNYIVRYVFRQYPPMPVVCGWLGGSAGEVMIERLVFGHSP